MQTSLSALVALALASLSGASANTHVQTTPTTARLAQPAAAQIVQPVAKTPSHPTRLVIPSIGLNALVEGVGVNEKGEMDVPSGDSFNVGWYRFGTIPGQIGSAVIDAHVFAAFADLKYLKPGSDIYVITAANETIHFVVSDMKEYALKALSPKTLFGSVGYPRLNLITCAGNLTKDRSTYDRRLIVSATLAT